VGPEGQNRGWRYWSPEGRDLLNYRHDEDYEEAFLNHYTRAVQGCLRTDMPVAVMLSGGRDSGSVTAIAAPLLAGHGRKLKAYTSIPCLAPDGAPDTRLGHEWDQAHTTALMAGANVCHVAVDASEYSVLRGIEYLVTIHDGPSHAAGNHYWLQAITDRAVCDGAGVLLTGQMGNGTISWSGNGSALLALFERQPRVSWQLLLHAEPNLWFTIKRQVLKPALTPALRSWRRVRSRGARPWQSYSALNPRMASVLDMDERMRAAGHDPTFTPSPLEDQRLNLLKPDRNIGAGLWSEIAATHAISIRDPTSNLAMLEFLLRVPDCQFRRRGEGSSLLRRALRDQLPKPVLEGRRKGLQSADLGHRVVKELPAVRQCLDAIDTHPAARELLNISLMRKCLTNLAAKVDPETTRNASNILLRGLGAGIFLRRFA
jgi:asparagine synthase (glutamine-hydrolysing)